MSPAHLTPPSDVNSLHAPLPRYVHQTAKPEAPLLGYSYSDLLRSRPPQARASLSHDAAEPIEPSTLVHSASAASASVEPAGAALPEPAHPEDPFHFDWPHW